MLKICSCFYLFLILFESSLYGQALNNDLLLTINKKVEIFGENVGDGKNLKKSTNNFKSEEERLHELLLKSEIYLEKNSFKEALKYLKQASLSEKTSENFKAYYYILYANFYRGIELNKKAKEYLDLAIAPLSLIENVKEKNYIETRWFLEKGLLGLALNSDEEALRDLWKSKSKAEFIDTKQLKSQHLQLIYFNLGNYYLKNDLDSAYFYFSENLQLAKQQNTNTDLSLRAKLGMGGYFLAKQQIDSASYYLLDSSSDLSQTENFRLKREALKNLSKFSYLAKDTENYKIYNQKYLTLNDSIYELDKTTRVLLANEVSVAEPKNFFSNKLFWTIAILLSALLGLILTYRHHLKVKREYAQFKKIMQKMQESEHSYKTEFYPSGAHISYSIPEKTEQIILEKLKKFEDSEKYVSPKVSLQYLAKQLDTNTKYLSEIINKHKGQNFNNYINDLRVHYILRKLKAETKYQNYKVSSLAEECGFNSRNTFTLAFKSAVGMSPAKFIGFIRKENYAEQA